MKKLILIVGCLAISIMSLFIFIASFGSLFHDEKDLEIAIPFLLISVFGFFIVYLIAKKHIFNHKDKRAIPQNKDEDLSADSEELYTYEDIVRAEIEASDLIEPLFKERVLEFQLQFDESKSPDSERFHLGDENDLLSVDEKKELGLNTRMKIPRYLSFALTDKGLHYKGRNPLSVFGLIPFKANHIIALQNEILRSQDLGMTSMKISSVGDERDCDWCLSMKDKVAPVSLDFVNDVLSNCRCEYPRILVQPQISF